MDNKNSEYFNALFGDRPQSQASQEHHVHGSSSNLSGSHASCYEDSSSESVYSSMLGSDYYDDSEDVSELGNNSFDDDEIHGGLGEQDQPMNLLGVPVLAPTYAEGEFEDNKATMIAKLMENHANFVTSSLIERSNLISSITWLSHHVPECVLKTLFRTIVRSRKKKAKLDRLGQALRQNVVKRETKKASAGSGDDAKTEEEVELNDDNIPTAEEPTDFTMNFPTIISGGLPIAKHHDSALLFIDISGFTKLSTTMEVENLSKAINSYFQMIVNEITNCGGDILKFAGDAIFVEWKVSRSKASHNLDDCVSLAVKCAMAVVANCSDYVVLSKPIGFTANSRRSSLISSSMRGSMLSQTEDSLGGESAVSSIPMSEGEKLASGVPSKLSILGKQKASEAGKRAWATERRRSSVSADAATLNVKCGVGVGHIVGIHVGDDFSRREYLILGDPIKQVAKAEGVASHGEVWASPETIECLSSIGNLDVAWQEAVKEGRPVQIANRKDSFYHPKRRFSHRESSMSCEAGSMLRCCDDLDTRELEWLKRMISLYVHPVVVNDNNERAAPMKRGSDHDRHLAEAELRNVYTCFITPQVDYKLTGDEDKDSKLFNLLNNIMNLTTRELDKVGGHLRQFILDDKGLVLIGTFGLRGSTFPNMIAQRAVPFSLSVHKALEEELGVKSKVGATFGKVYCGVVGGLKRHEFAALGPSVNLAARLMASKDNPGLLVDKNVRLLTSQVFFKPLPPVKAKGYDDPVPIFEPMNNIEDAQWGRVEKNFVGREKEIKGIMHTAKEMVPDGGVAKLLFVSAMSGTGKSTLMVKATEHVRAMLKKMKKRVVVTRNISNEGSSSRVPFSMFRSIFKDILSQVRYEDEGYQNRSQDGSMLDSRHRLDSSKRSLDGSRKLDNSSRHRLDSSRQGLDRSRRGRLSQGDDFSIEANWDDLSISTHSTKSSTMSTDATRFRYICQELNAPPEFMEVVGKRLLGLREKNTNTAASNAKPPDMKKIVDFMADAFIRCTRHAHLVLMALDDVQWMDEMSWKVVEAIFERGKNVLSLCGSHPLSFYQLAADPKFWSDLHNKHKQAVWYSEFILAPFTEPEVHDMIATTLNFEPNEVDSGFSRNIFHTTGGMPHFLSYALDTIGRNQLTVRLENGLVGMKTSAENADDKVEFGSVNELLLYRLDALDSSVRTVLHLSAVLGMEFDLLNVALAYEEMFGVIESQRADTAVSLRSAFDVAVAEGIIEQSYAFIEEEDEEDADAEEDKLCQSLGTLTLSVKGRKAHSYYTDNPRLRFTHDSWKQSILSVMLDERKREMHGHIATSLEKELANEAHNKDDFGKQIRVFKHWKSSGNFTKATLLALNIGTQLMMLGLNTQAILLFDDVLEILISMTDGDELYGGVDLPVLEAITASELEYLIKVYIAKGKAYATLRQGKEMHAAYQSALDILNVTPCADDEGFDRSVSFPIFSGLFLALKMGAIEQDEDHTYEKELCKKFVEQARLNGDPVHYGRASAMELETLCHLGNFEEALEVLERIKTIYDIDTQHSAICKAYGSDRVAQAWSHSVNCNVALGRTQEALRACDYIVEEIIPKSNPKNVHNTFALLYTVIINLKENGFPLKARDIFKARVIGPFEEHFGPGGSTYSKPLFRPIMTMLDLQGRQDQEPEVIAEYTAWALNEEEFEGKFSGKNNNDEVAWGAFSASPKALHSEICFNLSKRQENSEVQHRLFRKAISLMEQSVVATANLPYANMYAKKKLEDMKAYEMENIS